MRTKKGGVEGDVGRFRRTHLSPMPVVDSLAELNEKIRVWDRADEHRRVGNRIRTVEQDYALDRAALAPLPADRSDPGLTLTPRVDRSSLLRVRMASYLVPTRLIHRQVRVSLRASKVVVFDGRTEVARHPRVVARYGQSVDLDHYLEVLKTKPGALPGSTALAQARAAGTFTPAHEAFWAAARKTDGDAAGTRALIEVLLLHRSMTHAEVVSGLEAALQIGAVTADVVAVEARRAAGTTMARPKSADVAAPVERRVVSLTQRRLTDPAAVIAGLPADTRPAPSVTGYDELIALSRHTRPTPTELLTEETA